MEKLAAQVRALQAQNDKLMEQKDQYDLLISDLNAMIKKAEAEAEEELDRDCTTFLKLSWTEYEPRGLQQIDCLDYNISYKEREFFQLNRDTSPFEINMS